MRCWVAGHVAALPKSGIRDFFELVAKMKGQDVISLGVGEPDFVTPWHIREAAIYALERGKTSYTSNLGLLKLREAISHHLEKNFGVAYDAKTQILITVGVSEALDLALRAVGGSSYFKRLPLERYYRDVRAGLFHPFDSDEIAPVMDLCLSCKGCKSECPSNVDVARLKAEWLQQYYDTRGVPFRSKLIGGFSQAMAAAQFAPGIYNFLVTNRTTARLFKRLAGFADSARCARRAGRAPAPASVRPSARTARAARRRGGASRG
jgi:ferredoxin